MTELKDLKLELENKKKELKLLEKRMHKYFLLNRTDAYTKILLKVVRLEGEIAILEQAIAEMQKQRQEILDKIDKLENHFKDIELWENGLDKSEGYHKAEEYFEDLKQQLNQPKTEDGM